MILFATIKIRKKLRKICADIIYPIAEKPINNGVVVLDDNNTIVEISIREKFEDAELEILKGSLCPGFVNAHCHLELSHLKNKIEPHTGLVGFIQSLMQQRFAANEEQRLQAIADAETEMMSNGIVAVGDISNEKISITRKQKRNLFYHTFIEAVGLQPFIANKRFDEAIALKNEFAISDLKSSLAPHAPYSTSISLIQLISDFNQKNNFATTIHNQETEDEELFFENKTGNFLNFYAKLGLDISYFNAPQKTSLQTVIDAMPVQTNMLYVHNTFSHESDLQAIKQHSKNNFLCTCANANLFIENKLPDYNLWQKSGLKICMGTDSLASNFSLNMMEEIKTIQQHFPKLSLETLLKWATLNGAEFLGIENKFGSFEIGKQPSVVLLNDFSAKKIV